MTPSCWTSCCPGSRATEIVRTLRTEKNWVPVLMLSAKGGEYDQADGLDVGADDYLTKPFSYVVLVARLRALAAPRHSATAWRYWRPVTCGWTRAARTVTRGSTPVELTAREFSLLEYLIRHPGRVVGRLELLEHVWDAYGASEANVVEVYHRGICGAKSTRRSAAKRWTTVRGVGYRLEPDGG